MPIENPEKKCDEVQYIIDKLTEEVCKLKAVNVNMVSNKLVSKIRESLKHEKSTHQKGQDASKAKVKEVKLFMKKQKKLREA